MTTDRPQNQFEGKTTEELQSLITQREVQLHKALEEVEELKAQVAQYRDALQCNRSPEWEKEFNELAKTLERYAAFPRNNATIESSNQALKEAAHQLRYIATSFTLKANFVPYNLAIQKWWWQVKTNEGLDGGATLLLDMESFMREHNIPLEKPEGL